MSVVAEELVHALVDTGELELALDRAEDEERGTYAWACDVLAYPEFVTDAEYAMAVITVDRLDVMFAGYREIAEMDDGLGEVATA